MRGLEHLHPKARELAERLQSLCRERGLNLLITDTWRSEAEQTALYAKGRTAPGGIVTNCRYPLSPHNWGVAFDFCKNVKGHEYDDTAFFKAVGALAKTIGLFWGGDFKSFTDMPHLEVAEYLPSNSVATLQKQYGTPEKFKASWEGNAMAGQDIIIKRGDIACIGLYANPGKKSLAQIKAETGAAYILNGGQYTIATHEPCCNGLTIDGQRLAIHYCDGYAFNGPDIRYVAKNSTEPNFIGSYPPFVENGRALDFGIHINGVQPTVKRGRSAMGLLANGDVYLYCCDDNSSITLYDLQQDMIAVGCQTAINLDGGGSASCDFAGKVIKSYRNVYSLILIWRKDSVFKKGRKGAGVKRLQTLLNAKNNSALTVDGDFGSNTENAVKSFQMKHGLALDGIAGSKTLGCLLGDAAPVTVRPTLRRGSKGADVTYLQKLLMEHGQKLPRYGADGDFGAETEGAVQLFQGKNSLTIDGIVGPKTWTKLEG